MNDLFPLQETNKQLRSLGRFSHLGLLCVSDETSHYQTLHLWTKCGRAVNSVRGMQWQMYESTFPSMLGKSRSCQVIIQNDGAISVPECHLYIRLDLNRTGSSEVRMYMLYSLTALFPLAGHCFGSSVLSFIEPIRV
jgi:hypothetical protein